MIGCWFFILPVSFKMSFGVRSVLSFGWGYFGFFYPGLVVWSLSAVATSIAENWGGFWGFDSREDFLWGPFFRLVCVCADFCVCVLGGRFSWVLFFVENFALYLLYLLQSAFLVLYSTLLSL